MTIADDIDAAYEAVPPEPVRDYIGASTVGNPCEAFLAFQLRGFPDTPPDPRLKRVFKLGHRLEKMIIEDLRMAGYRIWDEDPSTDQQFEIVVFGGHVQMHADGFIGAPDWQPGDPARLLEIKSMNGQKWAAFRLKKLHVSHPRYFDQIQLMLGYGEVPEAVIVGYNKNTSEYHDEVIRFDVFHFESLRVTIERVMQGRSRKIASDRSDWRCKGCPKIDSCWKDAKVNVACQTCQYSIATEEGGWFCDLHGIDATTPCEDWKRYEPRAKA